MPRDRLPYLLFPLAALIPSLPLLVNGASCGHDLSFHLLSWQEAARQFAHGTFHPRWAYAAAYGAGEPRFVFYPPLSWTLGALLTLAAASLATLLHLAPAHTFATTPAVYTWLALTLAGGAMYRLARRYGSPSAATLAATLYLANPYTLFTAYERTAFAELLAAAWLPLLLAAILPRRQSGDLTTPSVAQRQDTPPPALLAPAAEPQGASLLSIPATAIPLALLWLTNAPAAVIGSYALAFVLTLRVAHRLRRREDHAAALRLALRSSAAATLGLALAAFYIVPAVVERPWVQISMAILPGLHPDENTLFRHTADAAHDAVLHTASLLALTLLAVTSVALARLFLKRRTPDLASALLAALTAAIAVLLTRPSLPLWHGLPELAFLQFPWRLLALLAPVCALALALNLRTLQLRPAPRIALALALPAALTALAYPAFHQPCDDEDTPQARYARFHAQGGDEPTDEYTPETADNDALSPTNPPFRLLPPDADDDTPPPANSVSGPAPHTLDLTLNAPAKIVLNLRDYPTWQPRVNSRVLGVLDPGRLHRNDGLIALVLPTGPVHLTLTETLPPSERAASLLSATAALSLILLLRSSRLHRHSTPRAEAELTASSPSS